MNLPTRIYCCPECGYYTKHRWVLSQHLRNAHNYNKNDSVKVASKFEYWLNPHYYRVKDSEDIEDE